MIKSAAIQKDGIIYTGRTHADILNDPDRPMGMLKISEQGFVTDKGKFVTRSEAAKIAYECKQIPSSKNILYSEDIN